jgi:predicted amidohydrolase YtcJ
LHGADASFDENEKGSIQQGKLADLRLAFLVSEEAAVKRKSEVKSIN